MPAHRPPTLPSFTNIASLLTQAAELRKAGHIEQSLPLMRKAVNIQPNNSRILHDFGLTCFEVGRLQEAIAAFQRATTVDPKFAKGFWRLGVALGRTSDTGGAIAALRRAVELTPALAPAQYRLAELLDEHGFHTDAVRHFRRAASGASKEPLGALAEARALMIEGRDIEAEPVLLRALKFDPQYAPALDLLGTALSQVGRFDEAGVVYERALTAAPTMVGSYYDLTRCRRLTTADIPLIDRMKAALSLQGPSAIERAKLHLALGKAFDDLGRYEEAMAAFDAADVERRRSLNFDLAVFERQVDSLIARFTPDVVRGASDLGGSQDRTPLLIVGMPRSGTTLAEQIVSSHPDVAAGGELQFWARRGATMLRDDRQSEDADFLDGAAADYLKMLRTVSAYAPRVTDKNPFNFLWAGLIHLAFPNAPIIHCRRSPIDTAISIHQIYFGAGLAFPTGGEALVGYYRAYERMMAHWRRVLPSSRFIEVDYETLTDNPEPEIRRMLAAAGLDWSEACLRPEDNHRVVKTPSRWQVRQAINRNSVERWRRYEPYLGALSALI